jgi:hypothetical protein
MLNELLARYYAFNIYYFSFNQENVVIRSVLKGIPEATTIYED